MNPRLRWHRAPGQRLALYADIGLRRVFVEQTVRAHRAHGVVGTEFQASVRGVRIGEYPTLEAAQCAAALKADEKLRARVRARMAQTKTAPQDMRGRVDGLQFDY